MGPTKNIESTKPDATRPRRGSLPDLKSSSAEKDKEKKVPTGPRANPLYKTRLCMNYQSTGSCPYTDKCQFAHGVKELEKWENWRATQKHSDDERKDDPDSEGTRSRSQSLEKTGRSISSGSQDLSHDFGSPTSGPWDMHTPVKRGSILGEVTPISSASSSNFSLWSTMMDDLEIDRPVPWNSRPRAATYDSTYDNISQLRDAPTLFPSPPVLSNLSRMNHSH